MITYNTIRKLSGNRLPRRFHCYCLGAAKTATTSISAMLEKNYDCGHEPEIVPTNHAIIEHIKDNLEASALSTYLEDRDNRLQLELESTHSLIYASKQLVQLFPEAKFLITVREPFSWLRSRLNFHFKKHPAEWEEYRKFFWMEKVDFYQPEEAILKDKFLAPLHVYLKQYTEHYAIAKQEIPDNRKLVIETEEISNKLDEIANFLNIKPSTIQNVKSNEQPEKAEFIDELNQEFVISSIWQYCKPVIEEYFPERISFYQNHADHLSQNNHKEIM